jgi:hypothetical protein
MGARCLSDSTDPAVLMLEAGERVASLLNSPQWLENIGLPHMG